jgi:fluoride ion exporter CrcB/FEX
MRQCRATLSPSADNLPLQDAVPKLMTRLHQTRFSVKLSQNIDEARSSMRKSLPGKRCAIAAALSLALLAGASPAQALVVNVAGNANLSFGQSRSIKDTWASNNAPWKVVFNCGGSCSNYSTGSTNTSELKRTLVWNGCGAHTAQATITVWDSEGAGSSAGGTTSTHWSAPSNPDIC